MHRERERLRARWADFFASSDAVLMPISFVPPLGLDADGLPIGLQVVGPYGGDYATIRLAGLIADLCGGIKAPPLA